MEKDGDDKTWMIRMISTREDGRMGEEGAWTREDERKEAEQD